MDTLRLRLLPGSNQLVRLSKTILIGPLATLVRLVVRDSGEMFAASHAQLINKSMELEVTQAFPTVIGQFRVPDAEAMNQDLQALILAEEGRHPSLGRSNIGGWHSRPDFLNRPEPAVSALTNWVIWVVRQAVDATAGVGTFKGNLSLSAWATICRAGAYHAPHSHPDSAWSGVYYVDAGTINPNHALSGVLEFLDPRAGVEAVSAPGDPYGDPARVHPESGLLVIFPSWLFHWVHPYAGQSPRIAVSFNATLGAPLD